MTDLEHLIKSLKQTAVDAEGAPIFELRYRVEANGLLISESGYRGSLLNILARVVKSHRESMLLVHRANKRVVSLKTELAALRARQFSNAVEVTEQKIAPDLQAH